jgi:hyperosmotically inducible periplasmic protein
MLPLTSKTLFKPSHTRGFASVCLLLSLPVLFACQRNDESKTVGQTIDGAVAKTEQAASDAKASIDATAEAAKVTIREGVDKAQSAARDTTAKMDYNADDAAITASVAAGLVKDPDLSALKIDVDTKNGIVSLYGPAPSESARVRATTIAKAVKGVVSVDNKLTVKTS